MNASRMLARYLLLVCLPLTVLAAPAGCDNQSDAGSQVVGIGGNGKHTFASSSPLLGTYKTRASGATKTKCHWRLLTQARGSTKVGDWNHVNWFGHGSVRIKPTRGQTVTLDSVNCNGWEMRK